MRVMSSFQCKIVGMIYLITYSLSVFDLFATLYLERRFGDIEANPFGRILLSNDISAIVYKVFVVGLAVWLLYRCRWNKVASVAIKAVCGVFSAIALYHAFLIGYSHFILFIRK